MVKEKYTNLTARPQESIISAIKSLLNYPKTQFAFEKPWLKLGAHCTVFIVKWLRTENKFDGGAPVLLGTSLASNR